MGSAQYRVRCAVSNNLLTSTDTPGRDELAARDSAALATVTAWLSDARFQAIRPQLETIRARLDAFVKQEAAP